MLPVPIVLYGPGKPPWSRWLERLDVVVEINVQNKGTRRELKHEVVIETEAKMLQIMLKSEKLKILSHLAS